MREAVVLCCLFLFKQVHCETDIDSTMETYNCHISELNYTGSLSINSLRHIEYALNSLLLELKTCKWINAVLLTDKTRPELSSAIAQILSECSVPYIHDTHDGRMADAEMRAYMKHLYTDLRQTNFILVASKPEEIIRNAEAAFKTKSTSTLSSMPHKTMWMALDWLDGDGPAMSSWDPQPAFFDNVASVSVKYHRGRDPATKLSEMIEASTLMWRQNRRRESDKVVLSQDGGGGGGKQTTTCRLFPNTRNGMNQRRLTVLAKDDWGSFVEVKNETYTGFTVEVVDVLAETMNFTRVLIPQPPENVSWIVYENMTRRGDVDFGLNLYMLTEDIFHRMDVTYPVKFDSVTAIYQYTSTSTLKSALAILLPLEYKYYVYIIVSFSSTVLFATAVYFLSSLIAGESFTLFRHRNAKMGLALKHPLRLTASIQSNNKRGVETCSTSIQDKFKKESLVFSFLYFLWTFGVFLLNQGYFRVPRSMSVRIIIGAWCLCNVVLYAIHTSSITAGMVVKKKHMAFTNYQQLLHNAPNRLVTLNASEILDAMNNSIGNSTVQLKVLPYDEWDPIVEHLEQNNILLYLEDLIKVRFMVKDYPTTNTVYMSKKLFTANRGFLMPNNSELTDRLSVKLTQLQEMGELTHMYNKRLSGLSPHLAKKTTATTTNTKVEMKDVLYPFCSVLLVLLVACVVLALEIGLCYFRAPHAKRKYQ